ncbi:MAG: Hsp70 family protein [Actinomycetota bacterium]|nr:Hsp70 family protein [Actinomycetota bacterium]
MSTALGVDLGTAYLSATLWSSGRLVDLPLGDRSRLLPANVFVRDDGSVIIGDGATRHGIVDPDGLVTSPASLLMGGAAAVAGGRRVDPVDLLAEQLSWVGTRAEEMGGRPPSDVVVAVPAGWAPDARRRLRDAAERIGWPSVRLAHQAAAAVTWAKHSQRSLGEIVAVVDLGTTGFRACVVDARGRPSVLASTVVEAGVGGRDLDRLILGHAIDRIDDEEVRRHLVSGTVEGRRATAALWRSCNSIKERLAADGGATIEVRALGRTTTVEMRGVDLDRVVDRAAAPAVGEMLDALAASCASLALRPASVQLIGGWSSVARLADEVGRRLGAEVADPLVPTAVSSGAALLAAGVAAPAGTPTGSAAHSTTGVGGRRPLPVPPPASDRRWPGRVSAVAGIAALALLAAGTVAGVGALSDRSTPEETTVVMGGRPVSAASTARLQRIEFPAPEPLAVGSEPVGLAAEATSGLAVAYDVVEGPCVMVDDDEVAAFDVGTCTIEASQAGDDSWLAANPVVREVDVRPAAPSPS